MSGIGLKGRAETKLLLNSAAGRRYLAGTHEVTNVLLQKLVVTVKLVVLLADGLYAVEDVDERVLKGLGVSAEALVPHMRRTETATSRAN